LGLVWLVLLVVELLLGGLRAELQAAVYIIWGLFIFDFGLRFYLAPHKLVFLRRNWLTVLSLALPALRFFAFVRALSLLRAVRGLRIVRIVSTLNRNMLVLRAHLARYRFGYVVALTLLVTLAGAAGMWALENHGLVPGGFEHFGDALWWTAMIMTTLGSGYWPQTPEGRVLGFLLALYAFSIFGYVTATLATYLIGRGAESPASSVAGVHQVRNLETKLDSLRAEIRALAARPAPGPAQE
jgi:voltage-gated potassium channel